MRQTPRKRKSCTLDLTLIAHPGAALHRLAHVTETITHACRRMTSVQHTNHSLDHVQVVLYGHGDVDQIWRAPDTLAGRTPRLLVSACAATNIYTRSCAHRASRISALRSGAVAISLEARYGVQVAERVDARSTDSFLVAFVLAPAKAY